MSSVVLAQWNWSDVMGCNLSRVVDVHGRSVCVRSLIEFYAYEFTSDGPEAIAYAVQGDGAVDRRTVLAVSFKKNPTEAIAECVSKIEAMVE